MKKCSLLLFGFIFFVLASECEARINLLELWHPGLDMTMGVPASYQLRSAFLWGDHFFEVPAEFTYVTSQNIEVGGRWGIKSNSGKLGLNDLMLGGKYIFLKEKGQYPGVLGEAAVSLPTGSFSDGTGTGSADFLFHWAAAKKFSKYESTFGLGIRLNGENTDKYSAGNVFFYHIGASYPLQSDTTVYGELKGYSHGRSKLNGTDLNDDYRELYIAPGVDYSLDRVWKFSCSLLIGLTSESNKLGLIVSTKF